MAKKPKARNIVQDTFSWDVSNWSQALEIWEPIVNVNSELKCLELGANQGGLSLWLALNGHSVVCSDVENPEPKARELHRHYSVEHLVEYKAVDATSIGEEEKYDIIIFKSILGGIGRDGRNDLQEKTIDNVYRALKPGGYLLFAENLEATDLHRFFRTRFTKWGAHWTYVKYLDVDSLLSSFSILEYKTCGFLGTFGRTEGQRRFLSFFDKWIFGRMFPSKFHYIVYGYGRKG